MNASWGNDVKFTSVRHNGNMYKSHSSKALGCSSKTYKRIFRRARVSSYSAPIAKLLGNQQNPRGVGRKMSQAIFKAGTSSRRNEARSQSLHTGAKDMGGTADI